MPVSNSAAALGEAVGKLIESRITSTVAVATVPKGYLAGPERLVNGSKNVYQIDCVVSSPNGTPVVIVDPAKKHNRRKGSVFTLVDHHGASFCLSYNLKWEIPA